MGQTFDFDDTFLTETNSFQYGDKIHVLEAINEDTCFVGAFQSDYIEQINKKNKKGKKLNISSVNDVWVTGNDDLCIADFVNETIVRLSTSVAVSKTFNTAPSKSLVICQSTEGGLLVTLMDQKDINQNDTADVWSDTWNWPVTSSVSTSTRPTVKPGCLLNYTTLNRTVTVISVWWIGKVNLLVIVYIKTLPCWTISPVWSPQFRKKYANQICTALLVTVLYNVFLYQANLNFHTIDCICK